MSPCTTVPIVQPVHRAWGKLSWDLSETTWKSNGGTERWQSWGGLKASCRGRSVRRQRIGATPWRSSSDCTGRVGRSAMCR